MLFIFRKRTITENLSKFFRITGYISAAKRYIKRLKILRLFKTKYNPISITPIWKISADLKNIIKGKSEVDFYQVFNKRINLNSMNWHKDENTGFEFPITRIDKLRLSSYYNKGIDVLYVWVQSRFHFAVYLAQLYLTENNEHCYKEFKRLVLDWINKNPFLYGVNWLSPMEAAIRSINWVIAANLFGKIFKNDKEFNEILSVSLQQHAEFISTFPEIYDNGHTTNHTTSDYAGLLFIALTLKDHPKSETWLKQAVSGLSHCMDYQVYDDGVDFEASIPYHRLVLELFSYSAIACTANNIALPQSFYSRLFKMFEYTAAYIDKSGNAPVIGDDDSGRIIVFNELNECNYFNQNNNHSYLLELGEHIFNYHFKSKTQIAKNDIHKFLPDIKIFSLDELNVEPRTKDQSASFDKGGAYFLKNQKFDFMLACFPIGQNGYGGHNHLDNGSFTISIDGTQFIVDPGTAVYSSNKEKRDRFRSYLYHNTLYSLLDEKIQLNEIGIWELKQFYTSKVNNYTPNKIDVIINLKSDPCDRKRTFEIKDNQFLISDSYNGQFSSRLNLHPDILIQSINKSSIITNNCEIIFTNAESLIVQDYEYSLYYQYPVSSKCIVISAKDNLGITIVPKKFQL